MLIWTTSTLFSRWMLYTIFKWVLHSFDVHTDSLTYFWTNVPSSSKFMFRDRSGFNINRVNLTLGKVVEGDCDVDVDVVVGEMSLRPDFCAIDDLSYVLHLFSHNLVFAKRWDLFCLKVWLTTFYWRALVSSLKRDYNNFWEFSSDKASIGSLKWLLGLK